VIYGLQKERKGLLHLILVESVKEELQLLQRIKFMIYCIQSFLLVSILNGGKTMKLMLFNNIKS